MRKNERVFLGVTAVIMVAVCSVLGLRMLYHNDENVSGPLTPVSETQIPKEETQKPKPEPVEKVYVNVFFIGQNANKEEVYRAVNREYDKDIDGPKIKFAIQSLISGPTAYEKSKGVYSEIPAGTRVISINETADKIVINLNSAFENGGGTDSLYKRLYQLIKTAKRNTNKPVYLYIEGNKAEVIGGEGIMITQPLNENSLDG
ncbi:MAG TPA: GerMN domain-containing protein [Candidatus Stercorousia faecigallinarum]|nr:GerMN domain-containing protein [Candidatus Stercorousia faecigallinarum]